VFEETGTGSSRLTPSGSLSEFSLASPGSRPHDVATGPDLTVPTERAGRIGSITASGLIAEISTPDGTPVEIAPGPSTATR
jgi:virginiamycin B lyase